MTTNVNTPRRKHALANEGHQLASIALDKKA